MDRLMTRDDLKDFELAVIEPIMARQCHCGEKGWLERAIMAADELAHNQIAERLTRGVDAVPRHDWEPAFWRAFVKLQSANE